MLRKHIWTVAVGDPDTIEDFVAARLGCDAVVARSLVERGAVQVGGKRAIAKAAVRPGVKVIARQPDESPATGGSPAGSLPGGPEALIPDLPIVLADAGVLVVDKPPGMLSQPSPGESAASVEAIIQKLHPGARLLSRLDRDASGLLLMSLHGAAHATLQLAMDEGRIERRYVAVCAGRLDQPRTVRLRIARDPRDLRRRRTLPEGAPGGLPAVTHIMPLGPFRPLDAEEGAATGLPASRIGVQLETGRTHQIRVHLAAIGHPLAGDRLYEGPPAPRLLLHAAELVFPHPTSGWPVQLRSSPSRDFGS